MRILLLVVVMALGSALVRAGDFPGPITLDMPADALCALTVDLDPGNPEFVVTGTADGVVAVYGFNVGTDQFVFRGRDILGGRVVDLAQWEGRPGSDQGVVVATADPDRLHFLELNPQAPYLIPVFSINLPEDPGTLAFTGDPGVGSRELAVSLPGIDLVLMFVPDGDIWRLDQELPAGDQPEALVGIDLDGDQVRELVAAHRGALSGSFGVWRRGPDGRYTMRTDAFAPGNPRDLAAFDLDGDGREELFTTVEGEPTAAMLRESAGLLEVVDIIDLPLPGEALTLDTLFDGSPGLFVTSADRGLVTFLQRQSDSWRPLDSYYPGCLPRGVITIDLNGDDARDLVCTGGTSQVFTALLAHGGPGYWGVPSLSLDGTPGPSLTGDFTGDGREDLAVIVDDQSVVNLFPGLPGGGYQAEAIDQDLGFFVGGAVALSADSGADQEIALLDLLARQVVVMEFTLGAGWSELSRTELGASPILPIVADLDADTHDDVLVLVRGTEEVRILFGDGAGGFDQILALGFGGVADRLATLDLDGDGYLDLAATDGNIRVWTQRNLDGRSFGDLAWVNAGSGVLDMAVGDLDGDLDDDLVTVNSVEESLSFFENDGSGELVRRIGAHALTSEPLGLAVEDIDLNGENEVLINLPEEQLIVAVYRVGSWNYSDLVELAEAPGVASFQVTDVNLDLKPDILAMDKSLEAGLTLLNLDQTPVASESEVLAAACEGGMVAIRVQPPGGESWRLEFRDGSGWQTMAADGRSATLDMDFDAGSWRLRAEPWAIGAADGILRLRLTTGSAAHHEVTVKEYDLACSSDRDLARGLLSWEREPWPNPFNPRVQARFSLARAAEVRVGVYDLAGRLMAEVAAGRYQAGDHTVTWNGRSGDGTAPAGIYFLKVDSPEQVLTRKIMLLK